MFDFKRFFSRPVKIDLVKVALEAKVKTLEEELKECKEHKGRRRRKAIASKKGILAQVETKSKKK